MERDCISDLDRGPRPDRPLQLHPCLLPPGRRHRRFLGLIAGGLIPLLPAPAAALDYFYFELDNGGVVSVAESSKTVSVVVVRQGENIQQLVVTYDVVADTATAGVDFITAAGELVWKPGESRKTLAFPILNDALTEKTESFTVRLTGVTHGGNLAGPYVVTVAIEDNDPGAHFGQHFYRIPERAGELTVNVFRGDDGNATRTLHYRTEDGTALGGVDFEPTAGDLVFSPGQVYLPLTLQLAADDSAVESIKTFRLLLSDASDPDNATAMATVQIDDDDIAIFSADDYVSLLARPGVVRVPIRREQALSWPASVRFETAEMSGSSSARPGIDFTPVSGQLDFAAGETLGYVEIPVPDPEREEWDYRPLTLRLSEISENTRVDRTEITVQITFGPEETTPPGQPADRVYGYPDRQAESLTPDGKFLLIGTRAGSYLWHLPTGRVIQQFDSGYTAQVSVSADGSQVATSDGQRISLWNLGAQQARQTLYSTSRGLNFSPDGSQLITTSWEGRLKVFQTSDPAPWRSQPDRDVGEGTRYVRMVSPSGRWMLADAGDLATVWDLRTGGIALALPAGRNVEFAISPDETRLLVTSEGRAELWDLETHARLGRFPEVTSSALAHHANRLALAGPGQLEVRSSGGEGLWKTNFSTTLRAMALSPDGRHLAAVFAPNDGSYYRHDLRLWNLETGAEFTSTGDFVTAIQFSPDSRSLMLNGFGAGVLGGPNVRFIAAVGTVSQRVLWTHSLTGYVSGPFAFSPDSTRVVLPTFQGVEVRQMTDGLITSTWPVMDGNAPAGLGWSPEGITEVAETIRLRNATAPHELLAERPFALGIRGSDLSIVSQLAGRAELWFRQPYGSHSLLIDSTSLDVTHRFNLALQPQAIGGQTFAAVDQGTQGMTLFDLESEQRRRTIDLNGTLRHAALSPDDQILIVQQYFKMAPDVYQPLLRALDTGSGEERWRRIVGELSGQVPLAAITQTDRFVYSPDVSGLIHFQEVGRTEPTASIGGHGNVAWLALAPDEDHALAVTVGQSQQFQGERPRHLALWDLRTGQIERLIEGRDPSLSQNGRRLLYNQQTPNFGWRLETLPDGRALQTWEPGPDESFSQVTLSPDGEYVAARGVAAGRATVWLWRATSGELVWQHSFDDTQIYSLTFSPDSRLLAVGNEWQFHAWLDLYPIPGGAPWRIELENYIYYSILFSPDASRLLILSAPATLWDTVSRSQVATLGAPWPWGINSATFSSDSRTLYLATQQATDCVVDCSLTHPHLLVANATSGQVISELPDPNDFARLTAFADEEALLAYAWNSGTGVFDTTGTELRRLSQGFPIAGPPPVSTRLALSQGGGRFGLWDVSDIFKHRLRLNTAPTGAQLDWRTGTLQSAPDILGPWTDLPNARGPWAIPNTEERTFFRVKGQ